MTSTIYTTQTKQLINHPFKSIDVQIFPPNYAIPGISDFLTHVTNRNIRDKKEQVRDLREGKE
jgi:hypothetical protein